MKLGLSASLLLALGTLAFLVLVRPSQAFQSPQARVLLTPEQAEILSHMSLVMLDDGTGNPKKTLRISGLNVQIVNGLGSTQTADGTGNLIVGYNEPGSPAGDVRTG